MKARRLLKSLFLLPAVLLAFTSCKDDDPEFGIYRDGVYVMQTDLGFEPHIYFSVVYGDLKSGSITHNSMPLSGKAYSDYNVYALNPSANMAGSLSALNGTYRLAAESTEGKTTEITGTLEFSSNKAIGAIELIEFEYKNDYLDAKMEEVENADYYGFYIEPYVDGQRTSAFFLHDWQMLNPSKSPDGTVSVRLNYPASNVRYDKVHITPIAINRPNNNAFLVFRKAGAGKVLVKGASAFE